MQGSVWTLLTSNFVDTSLVNLAADILAALGALSIAQPAYGSAHMVKLLLAASLAAGLCCFTTQYVVFYIFKYGSGLFVERHGFYGILGALLMAVACTSAAPEQVPRKKLPATYLLACLAVSVVSDWASILPFSLAGMLASWVYIRRLPAEQRGAVPLQMTNSFEVCHVCHAASCCACVHRERVQVPESHSTQGAVPSCGVFAGSSADCQRRCMQHSILCTTSCTCAGAAVDEPAAMGLATFWPISRSPDMPVADRDPFAEVSGAASTSKAAQAGAQSASQGTQSSEASRRRQLGMQALDERLAASRGSAAQAAQAAPVSMLQSSLTGERRPLSRPASAAADLSAPPPMNGAADEV